MKRTFPKLSALVATVAPVGLVAIATAVFAQDAANQDRGSPPPPPQAFNRQSADEQDWQAQSDRQRQQQRASSQAQAQTQRRGQQPQQTQRDRSQLVSVTGQVIRTKQVDIRGSDRRELVALLRTQDGRRQIVELGNAGSSPRGGIRSGDQITVRGRPVRRGDYQIILASQVYAQGAWANIDRSQRGGQSSGRGYPIAQQSRTVEGQVAGTRAVRLRDSDARHLVARIRTDEGRYQVVDLGPRERVQQRLSLREGDRIRVRGRTTRIQDRPLLLASTVQTDEGSFTIPRDQRQQQQQQQQQQQRQTASRGDDRRMQQQAAQEFIRQHDENGDGRLSQSELPDRLSQEFEQMDRNGDNRLSQSELVQHAQRMSARLIPVEVTYIWFTDANRGHIDLNDLQQAYKLLQQIDQNGDGQLTRSELRERREQVATHWINSLLERVDENGDGTISQQEARGTLLAQQFEQFDRNSDGRLSRGELRRFAAPSDDDSSSGSEEARRREQEQIR